MFDLEYNNDSASDHNLYIKKRPDIPAPEEEVKTYTVAGRDGILTGDRRLLPVQINAEFAFMAAAGEWQEKLREAKEWLRGSGSLSFTDDGEWFYKVLSVKINETARQLKKLGTFTAAFTCDPYMYRYDGLEEKKYPKEKTVYTLTNDYDECHPAYIVYGSGSRTLTVNGNAITVSGSGTMLIDTDRMITCLNSTGGIANASMTGEYEGLYLKEGSNTLKCTAAMAVIPNWRSR